MTDLWLKEKHSLGCYCPFEPPDTVITGMNFIGDKPPGKLVGEFEISQDGQLKIELYQ